MIEKAPKIEGIEAFKDIQFLKMMSSMSTVFNRIQKEYFYWDKIKYLREKNISSEHLWGTAKILRSLERKTLPISGKTKDIIYHFGINDYLQQKLHYLDFNFGAGIQKEQLLTELEKQQYLNNALMEESIFSSMIEGATTTRVKAKDMLRKNKKPKNKSEQMIVNNYNTIHYISEHKSEDISIEKLYTIHKLVTENTLKHDVIGTFRKSNDINVVNELTGEIVHTPPNFKELEDLMLSYCTFFNENPKDDFIHPIVKASILHFLIGYIHPFVDGNGRTARAIFYWYLLKNGYWLTEYLSISRVIMKTKTQYEKAYLYTEIDDMDVTYFIHYQVKVLMKAFEELKEYVAKKKEEENNLLKYLKIEGINERQAQILFKLEKNKNKFFTVKEIENTFGVTNQTARTDIEELVNKKLVKKQAINKKSFNYWRSDAFDTLIPK